MPAAEARPALDADALVVVATHPLCDTTTKPQADGLAPDVDDIFIEFVDSVLAGRTAN